jgi:hypothetical protein
MGKQATYTAQVPRLNLIAKVSAGLANLVLYYRSYTVGWVGLEIWLTERAVPVCNPPSGIPFLELRNSHI